MRSSHQVAPASASGPTTSRGGDAGRSLRNGYVLPIHPENRDTEEHPMATVSVRYIVDDVDTAIAFYCQHLGFH
jgi:hypothetical protein